VAGLTLLAITGFGIYYFGAHARQPLVQQTVALSSLARQITLQGGEEFPLTHVDDPMTLQIYLNTLRPSVAYERAAELLRGPAAAFVVVTNLAKLESARSTNDPPIYELLPTATGHHRPARLLSNRPTLRRPDAFAFCVGPIFINARSADLVKATEGELTFAALNENGSVDVVNESSEAHKVRIITRYRGTASARERTLSGGESWTLKLAEP